MKMNGQIKKSIVHSNRCEGTFVVLSMISILENMIMTLPIAQALLDFQVLMQQNY